MGIKRCASVIFIGFVLECLCYVIHDCGITGYSTEKRDPTMKCTWPPPEFCFWNLFKNLRLSLHMDPTQMFLRRSGI